MSIGAEYGDEYENYLDEFDEEWGGTLGMAPMSFNDWINDKLEGLKESEEQC